jgi:hypothetical protein
MKVMLLVSLLGFADQDEDAGLYCGHTVGVEELFDLVDYFASEEVNFEDGEEISWPVEPVIEVLPAGEITGETLAKIVQEWKVESPTLLKIFERISDGQTRTISGQAVRDAIGLVGLTLPNFIPAKALVEVVIANGQVQVFLDGDQRIDIEEVETWVFESENQESPYAVDDGTVPYRHESMSYTLHVNETLVFDLDETGLHGIRKGDLLGVKFIFSKDINLSSIHGEPDVQRLDGAVVLETDTNGNPLVVDGFYVPKTSEEWIEVTAGNDVSRIPLARMGQPY